MHIYRLINHLRQENTFVNQKADIENKGVSIAFRPAPWILKSQQRTQRLYDPLGKLETGPVTCCTEVVRTGAVGQPLPDELDLGPRFEKDSPVVAAPERIRSPGLECCQDFILEFKQGQICACRLH